MNNKGLSIVEIIAAVILLSTIVFVSMICYTGYSNYSKDKSYEIIAKSATVAAEQYVIDNPGIAVETEEKEQDDGTTKYIIKSGDSIGISFNELIHEGYLNESKDPDNKESTCDGYVVIGRIPASEEDFLEKYIYDVDLCCKNKKNHYYYTFSKNDGIIKSIVDSNIDLAYCERINNYESIDDSGF